MKYFCVFPHCYVKANENSVLVINPHTKRYVYSASPVIVGSFINNKNSYSYCIFDEKDKFYADAVSKQLGYIIEASFPPYYASPKISFVASMNKEKKALGYNTGWYIPSFIKSLSIHFNNKYLCLPQKCLFDQLEYPNQDVALYKMDKQLWMEIFSILSNSPIEIIQLCGDIDNLLLETLDKIEQIYHNRIVVRTVICEYEKITSLLCKYSNLRIDFIISDITVLDKLLETNNVPYNEISFTIPLFSLENFKSLDTIKFQVKYIPLVYDTKLQSDLIEQMQLNFDDILRNSKSIEDSLIKGIINSNFWGSLTIKGNGVLFVADEFVGDTKHESIYSVLNKWLQKSQNSWMMTRDKYFACKNCLFVTICPNISIYEKQGILKRACLENVYTNMAALLSSN